MVDEAGYLPAPTSTQLADEARRTAGTGRDACCRRCRRFDPPGVFARSLAECLALQLKEQNRYDPQIAALARQSRTCSPATTSPALRKAVGVEMDELADMIDEIKQLNPKPGLKFGTVQMQPVVPDVLVRAAPDGSWLVELNSRHAAARAGQPHATSRGLARPPGPSRTRTICSSACRPPTGW